MFFKIRFHAHARASHDLAVSLFLLQFLMKGIVHCNNPSRVLIVFGFQKLADNSVRTKHSICLEHSVSPCKLQTVKSIFSLAHTN